MIQIFGTLFFIILICLIYLHYQGKISRNIPIIFMFFLIVSIPFTYLEKNNKSVENFSSYDQIMNSSLDIFYTKQNKKKRDMGGLKKIPILYNPLKATIVKRDMMQFEIYLYSSANQYNVFYLIYNNKWNNIYYKYGSSENILTYFIEDDLKKSSFTSLISSKAQNFTNLDNLSSLIEKAPRSSYIIITANNIAPIKNSSSTIKNTFITKYKFSNWINTNTSEAGSLLVILAKSNNDTYTVFNESSTSSLSAISIQQVVKIDPIQVETNGGDLLPNVKPNELIKDINSDPLINSKTNVISPGGLNPDYSLSITVENNESFVYLSSNKLDDEIVPYSKSPKSDIGPTSTTKLDTERPQYWSFEPVTPIVTNPLIVFIRTFSEPYFYLDAEYENGTMVLKAKRFKAGLRQQWELMKNPKDKSKYNIRHLKSGMYLAYSDFDGYLYKSDGSVFLSKSSNYIWNIKPVSEKKTVRQLLQEKCPLRISETRNGVVFINPTNGATRDSYLFSGCTESNTCDTRYIDPISKNILDNIPNNCHCGCWDLGNYWWDNGARKWIKKTVVENFQPNKKNSLVDTEVPTDFSTIENPSWKISGNAKGQDITIESNGRTVWKSNFSPVWSGRWIYRGTVESYKATLDINAVKFLIIKVDANGKGEMIDEYFNYTVKLENAGSNILTGIIPSGKYKDYRATLKLLPTELKYADPSKPFPIKMRYIIQKDSKILNLSSSDINNEQSYSTKFLGDNLILANFLEASGIQTDIKLAFSPNNLEKIDKSIKEQIAISDVLKIANKFMINKIKKSKLIYKASRNGWNPHTFHNLCDNKGPTITIATLQDGRIIGAYTPVPWGKSNNSWINNKNTFLFDSNEKYVIDEFNFYQNAIYQNSYYGPIFGAGHDFISLSYWSPQTISTYSYMYLNNNKGPLGVPRYTSNVYKPKELEVFSVTIQNNPENEWKIIPLPGFNSPMKLDEISGDPQCLSYDGLHCVWDYVPRYGENLDYIDKNRVNPLSCGDDAKNKWGTDGYYEGHWCNTMRKYYNPKVVIYEGGNYTGRRLELDPGTYDFNFINSKGFNDVISSLTVPPGWKVEAWEGNPGEGRRSVYTSDTTWVGDANDTFSSLVITSNENSNLYQKLDNTNCVYSRIYNGVRSNGNNNDYNYLGEYSSYDECLKKADIPSNAKAITYHNQNIGEWSNQCFSINDSNTRVPNQYYATCGIKKF